MEDKLVLFWNSIWKYFINIIKELCNINNLQHCHNYPDIIITVAQIRLSIMGRTLKEQTYQWEIYEIVPTSKCRGLTNNWFLTNIKTILILKNSYFQTHTMMSVWKEVANKIRLFSVIDCFWNASLLAFHF